MSGGAFALGDWLAINELLVEYCWRVDSGDFAGVAELFALADVYSPNDATPISRDPAALAAVNRSFVRVYEDGTPRTRHLLSNVSIVPDGETGAAARSYFTVVQATEDVPLQPVLQGRYRDRFTREAGVWRFSERRLLVDFAGNLSGHLKSLG